MIMMMMAMRSWEGRTITITRELVANVYRKLIGEIIVYLNAF